MHTRVSVYEAGLREGSVEQFVDFIYLSRGTILRFHFSFLCLPFFSCIIVLSFSSLAKGLLVDTFALSGSLYF